MDVSLLCGLYTMSRLCRIQFVCSSPSRVIRNGTFSSSIASQRLNNSNKYRSQFSTSSHRPLMDLVGFSEEILTVHDAISQICSKFPNTYWEEHGQKEQDPKEFHAAKEGWLHFSLSNLEPYAREMSHLVCFH